MEGFLGKAWDLTSRAAASLFVSSGKAVDEVIEISEKQLAKSFTRVPCSCSKFLLYQETSGKESTFHVLYICQRRGRQAPLRLVAAKKIALFCFLALFLSSTIFIFCSVFRSCDLRQATAVGQRFENQAFLFHSIGNVMCV